MNPIGLILLAVTAAQSASPFSDPHMLPDRSVIVQMFEWRFDDLANECEQFLGPNGYGAIQVSPLMEHAIVNNTNEHFPWWQRYQAVSYKIDKSRSGTKRQLQDMIDRCNKAGVRVYVDVILNHMTGSLGRGIGSAGSNFDGNEMSYPGVGFERKHFHSKEVCGTSDGGIHDWDDSWQLRMCELVGLHDLDHYLSEVQEKQAAHLNELISMGVAGFRVDASKHMWPEQLGQIFEKLKDLNSTTFGSNKRPFIYHECSKGSRADAPGPNDYTSLGRVINFAFMRELAAVVKKENNQRMKYLWNFGSDWGLLDSIDSVNIVDNHDIQREPHYVSSFKNGRIHKMATLFMLAWPYGVPKVMSSYHWDDSKPNAFNEGPPHNPDFTTARVKFDGNVCTNGWVCEHRWRQIFNMVRFRNIAGFTPVTNWWDNGYQQIAFGRQGKAFIAFNNEDFPLRQWLQTGMPAGRYCDVISGEKERDKCTGRSVEVFEDGKAEIEIANSVEDPIFAIHLESRR